MHHPKLRVSGRERTKLTKASQPATTAAVLVLQAEEIRKQKVSEKLEHFPVILIMGWECSDFGGGRIEGKRGKKLQHFNIFPVLWKTAVKLVKLLAINFDYDVCC